MLDGDALWTTLRSLDDPLNLEFPADFDWQATRERFDRLVARLARDFSCRARTDREVQDASFHALVSIPAEATGSGRELVLRVSNFGRLAVLSVDLPGTWTRAEMDDLLHPDDAERVRRALVDERYVEVPEEPLWAPYDGTFVSPFGPHRMTWWERFFDYL